MTYWDEYEQAYNDAEPDDGFRDVPPGTYQVYVDRAEIKEPKDPAKPHRLSLWCKVLRGEFEGAMVFPGAPFSHMNMVKGIVARCGVDIPDSVAELVAMIDDGVLLDRVLEVKVQRNGEYLNAYVQRFIRMLSEDSGEEPPPIDDDEIPF
jgi:hypothetical protein